MALLFDGFVHGLPATKGSLRPVGRSGRNPFLKEQTSDRLTTWFAALRAAIPTPLHPTDKPVCIRARYYFPRPKSHYDSHGELKKAQPRFPSGGRRYDIDKLLRALLDALTGYLWVDDSQVISVRADKLYADFQTMQGLDLLVEDL